MANMTMSGPSIRNSPTTTISFRHSMDGMEHPLRTNESDDASDAATIISDSHTTDTWNEVLRQWDDFVKNIMPWIVVAMLASPAPAA